MTYLEVKSLKPEDFKRLCGLRPDTFNQMLEVVRSHSQRKQKTGRPVIWQRLEKLNTSIVASITGWGFILDALFVSGFS
ncbi:hypothetical protein [Nostoc sp.]|uniref:hypothetical protein n=1 Tax=Nostoc sp. TaxID=1180 RepID=UPI002FF61CE0